MSYRNWLLCILLFFYFTGSLGFTHGSGSPTTIKIAVMDNFNLQKSIVSRYNNLYVNNYKALFLPGLYVAENEARKKGYKLIYKLYSYDRTPLGIIKIVDDVTQWQPDVIIGPRDSNTFLLLSGYFKDTLVLSPFATSDEVSKMPKNFYSLTAPTKYTAKAIAMYLDDNYKNSSVFGIIDRNCKNCVDLSKDFLEQNQNKKYIHYEYISSSTCKEMAASKLNTILSQRKEGDVFFIPDTLHVSTALISEIVPVLHDRGVFIGSDGWGTWGQSDVGKAYNLGKYTAIRITPWSLDIKSDRSEKFKKAYMDFLGSPPVDTPPYIAYTTVDSIIESLSSCKNRFNNTIKHKILICYMDSLKRNKNWFRPSDYAVYSMSPKDQKLVSVVHLKLDET